MRKFFLTVLVILLAGVVGAFLYVRSAYPPHRLVELLEPRLEAALGRPVRIGHAELTPFPLAARLEDIQVRSETGFGAEDALLRLEALRFDLQWLPLLRREIAVRSLVLDRPRVFLERNSEGRWNFESSAPPTIPGRAGAGAPTETPLGLRIESLRVREAVLELHDELADVALHVPFDGELLLRADRALRDLRVNGWLESHAVSGGDRGRLQAMRQMRLRIEPRIRADVPDSSAVVDALRIELQGLALDLEGRVRLRGGKPTLHLRTRSDEFRLAEILSLVPADLVPAVQRVNARGSGKLALQVERTAGEPIRLAGHLSLTDGVLEHPEWPTPVDGLQADIEFSERLLTVSKLEARVADAPLRASGEIHHPLAPHEATYDLDVQAKLDLQRIAPMLPSPAEVEMQGEVGADIQVRGALKPGALPQITGPITLHEVRVESPQLKRPLQIDAELRATGDLVRIHKGTLRAGEDSVALEGELTLVSKPELPRLKLRGSATQLDLDALLTASDTSSQSGAASAGAMPPPTLLPKLPSAHLDVALRADELVVREATFRTARVLLRGNGEQFDLELHGDHFERDTMRFGPVDAKLHGTSDQANGTLRTQHGRVGRLELSSLQSDLTVQGTRIELANLVGKAYRGALEGKIVVDLADPESPSQEVDVRVEEVQLASFLGDLWSAGGAIAGSLSGTTQLTFQGSEAGAIRSTLEAAGQGIAVNGRLHDVPLLNQLSDWLQVPSLEGTPYRELGFDFEINAGRVRFPRLQLVSQDVALAVLGSFGLDGSLDLDLNVQLADATMRSSLQGPLAQRIGSLFTNSEGALVLDFDVRGTYRAPRLHPNFERTAARRGLRSLRPQDLRRLLERMTEDLGSTPRPQDTLGKRLEDAVEDGVKDTLGGLFGKRSAQRDSTPKP